MYTSEDRMSERNKKALLMIPHTLDKLGVKLERHDIDNVLDALGKVVTLGNQHYLKSLRQQKATVLHCQVTNCLKSHPVKIVAIKHGISVQHVYRILGGVR